MESRFFGGDSSSSGDESASSSGDEKPQQKQDQVPKGAKVMGRWAEESSSDDDAPKRAVMRSHSDKRYAQINDVIKAMKNHMKIEDFAALSTDFGSLNQAYEKLKMVLKDEVVPPFFIKALGTLDQFVVKLHQSGKVKTMTQSKARAFNTLRAKIRKGNKEFEEDLKRFEEHPSEFEGDAADEAENDDKSSSASSSKSDGSDSDGGDSDDSDSDSDSGSDKSSDSSSDSGDSDSSGWDASNKSSSDEDLDEEARRRKRMQKWLKTAADYEEEAREKAKTEQQKQDKCLRDKKKEDARILAEEKRRQKLAGETDPTISAAQANKQEENLSFEELTQKVNQLVQSRGRKGMDRQTLRKMAADIYAKLDKFGAINWKIYVTSHLVSVEFDKTEGAFRALRHESWIEILENLHCMLELFESWDKEDMPDDSDRAVSFPVLVEGLIAHLENLDDELYKSLQFSGDASTPEFQQALQNSHSHIRVLRRAMRYMEKLNRKVEVGKLASRLIEQLYYRQDDMNAKVYRYIQSEAPEEEKSFWVWPTDSIAFIEQLRRKVDVVPDPRMRIRALMCQAYHLALHDHYRAARNLLHFSNTVERVAEMTTEVNTQILFNRVLGQIGLCAFRQMMIHEAHNALVELCAFMKTKELLAQGMSYYKYQERSEDQEKKEKKRQVPYPMHIDLDFLECVHLICAMLLEIPNIAHQTLEPNNKKIISKPMRRLLESQNHQTLQTPPENAREMVISACRYLKKADWQKCISIIDDLRFWRNIQDADHVKQLLHERIKVEALRTFMFTSLCSYTAFNCDQLVDFFELPKKKVHSTVSKMIINNEIPASWDSTSEYIVVQRSELTVLHKLALELSDRVVNALENNERTLDVKCGNKDGPQQKGHHLQQRWDPQQQRRGFGRGRVPPVLDDAQRRKGKGKGNGKGKSRGGFGNGWDGYNRDGYNRDGYNRGGKGSDRRDQGYSQRGQWGR